MGEKSHLDAVRIWWREDGGRNPIYSPPIKESSPVYGTIRIMLVDP